MAALSTFYHPLCAHHNHRTARHSVRSLTVVSCRQQKSPEESGGVIQRTVIRMISEAGKIGKNLKPEKKGDMKDLMLMSLSFAVYVYISQLMVPVLAMYPQCPIVHHDPMQYWSDGESRTSGNIDFHFTISIRGNTTVLRRLTLKPNDAVGT
ncbi:hypothetical protein IGI04_015155 [Brassica rapa subsp. trilocularis]|uniref:Uncharacterized protein n=1 Tax=Brassica rapa subsp. trilocularis TaxID=1813537 RepID=A0ABQ7MP83_BRACM|nr:hypothetical protein IGI04_015155 [Brassica rapa subsp. trilocularis]